MEVFGIHMQEIRKNPSIRELSHCQGHLDSIIYRDQNRDKSRHKFSPSHQNNKLSEVSPTYINFK